MPTAEISMTVHRPVEEVFDYAVAIDRLAEWNDVIIDAWPTSENQAAVGATYVVKARFGGREMELPSEVIAYERNRRYAYRSKGFMAYTSTKFFEPTKEGTRVTERLHNNMGGRLSFLIAPLMLSISRRSHQKNLELLKTTLETAALIAPA